MKTYESFVQMLEQEEMKKTRGDAAMERNLCQGSN